MGKPASTWKNIERWVAKYLKGERTHWAQEDVRAGDFAIEVKYGKQVPKWLLKAWKQAQDNSGDRLPLLVIHPYRWKDEDSLAVLSIKDLKCLLENLEKETD